MHIEPGVVSGAKMFLSYMSASVSFGVATKVANENIKENGLVSFVLKTIIATAIVFSCFEILPHYPIGVSEVHLILGTTIYLIFGFAPALFGLSFGLLIQGLFFAPFDLPQYGINVTTLMASLIILHFSAKKIIPKNIAYKNISYTQLLKLSIIWEGSIVSWVTFWALYGQGFSIENLYNIIIFDFAYMSVIILEPIIDLVILAFVKSINLVECNILFDKRVCKVELV